jgi:phage recombination protein Bet
MTQAISRVEQHLPATQAGGWDRDKIELVKRTICKDASDDELALFQHVCQRTGLDPFARQIYAVFRNSKLPNGSWGRVMGIQTGIDGYRAIAERTGCYAGSDEAVFEFEAGEGHPTKASVTVWKMVHGQRVPFSASARWSEYVQTDKSGNPTKFWAQMPYLMLSKVAEALALRKAFPNDLSGLYTREEMMQAENGQEVVDGEAAPAKKPNGNGSSTTNGHAAVIASLGKKPAMLASGQQVDELKALLTIVPLEDGIVSGWLKKARVAELADLSAEQIEKCLAWVKEKGQIQDAEFVATVSTDELADAHNSPT